MSSTLPKPDVTRGAWRFGDTDVFAVKRGWRPGLTPGRPNRGQRVGPTTAPIDLHRSWPGTDPGLLDRVRRRLAGLRAEGEWVASLPRLARVAGKLARSARQATED